MLTEDTVLVAELSEQFKCLLSGFGNVCERRKVKINVEKIKVMVLLLEVVALKAVVENEGCDFVQVFGLLIQ